MENEDQHEDATDQGAPDYEDNPDQEPLVSLSTALHSLLTLTHK